MSHESSTKWGRDGHALVSVEQACTAVAAGLTPLMPREVSIHEAAGLVLAAPITAADNYPAFDKAMMDGFAVRSMDCGSQWTELQLSGMAAAGTPAEAPLAPGHAMRINTGAPLPEGSDSVVPVEAATISNNGRTVCMDAVVRMRQNVETRGAVRKKGDVVLTPPQRLGPVDIAAAITAGASVVSVYPRPGVAIVLTGDEIVSAGGARKPGQIHDSNGPMLAALMRQFGADPREPTMSRDDTDALTARLADALTEPIVVTVGGMSMGTLDLVPKVFESLGVSWQWHGVSMRPGRPAAYGRGPGGQHIFGLPGNPLSAFVCAWLFVRMAVEGLQGMPARPPARWRATLASQAKPSTDPRPAYVPAKARLDGTRGLLVDPCAWRGSGDPFGAAGANALLIRANAAQPAAAGTPVEVILIGPIGAE